MSTQAWARTHEYAAKTEMKVCTQYLKPTGSEFFREPLVE